MRARWTACSAASSPPSEGTSLPIAAQVQAGHRMLDELFLGFALSLSDHSGPDDSIPALQTGRAIAMWPHRNGAGAGEELSSRDSALASGSLPAATSSSARNTAAAPASQRRAERPRVVGRAVRGGGAVQGYHREQGRTRIEPEPKEFGMEMERAEVMSLRRRAYDLVLSFLPRSHHHSCAVLTACNVRACG
eukprot:591453-Rhodomonas_salina.1